MRTWNFDNGVIVGESSHDADLHCFEVFNGDRYLGTVYPNTIEDMNQCIKALDNGEDPISGGWEDGCGNTCSMNGWGNGAYVEGETERLLESFDDFCRYQYDCLACPYYAHGQTREDCEKYFNKILMG